MNKIGARYWFIFITAIVDFVLAVVGFVTGGPELLWLSILLVILGSLNLVIFLMRAALWWTFSPEVPDKFVFTCPKCEHQFIPTFWAWLLVPHLGSGRYMKCEKCNKISWMRRK